MTGMLLALMLSLSVEQTGKGTYVVNAAFEVAAPPEVVRAVLTDYENIARYLPGIRRSIVHERTSGRVRVEQEAVSRYLLFSKTVHLLLDVREEPDVIAFRDECGRSFTRYEGSWRLTAQGEKTAIVYRLTAQPAFDVPEFMVGRVLNRDAADMIKHLRAEIARRAQPDGREVTP